MLPLGCLPAMVRDVLFESLAWKAGPIPVRPHVCVLGCERVSALTSLLVGVAVPVVSQHVPCVPRRSIPTQVLQKVVLFVSVVVAGVATWLGRFSYESEKNESMNPRVGALSVNTHDDVQVSVASSLGKNPRRSVRLLRSDAPQIAGLVLAAQSRDRLPYFGGSVGHVEPSVEVWPNPRPVTAGAGSTYSTSSVRQAIS